MNWQDTVIKKKWMDKTVKIDQDKLLSQQAEISFKAGIKEAVGWVETTRRIRQNILCLNLEQWQAKLKEWGVRYD